MDDLVLSYMVQFVTIGAVAMGLSEWATLPIGRTSPEPNRGNRKRYNAFIYAFVLGALGWYADLVEMPGTTWQTALAGVALMSVVTVGVSGVVVAAKKKLTAPNVSNGGGGDA
jgi:hypothetical protein